MNKTTEALKLAEALENDAKEHREVSYGLDCPPERTANWKHALNCEAAARLIREVLAKPTNTRSTSEYSEPVKQEPASNKYNHKRIGWELERTAMGDPYYGNALYSAMDLHFLNKREKDCLHRYMHGSETPNDRFVLQDIANKVYFEPGAEPVKPSQLADASLGPVAWRRPTHNGYAYAETHFDGEDGEPLYTRPQAREWVWLTDEEIMDRWPCETRIEFARWIEAKLKEKNT